MNRRNKLQINSAENTLNTMQTDSIVLNPRLTDDCGFPPPATIFDMAADTTVDPTHPGPRQTVREPARMGTPRGIALCIFRFLRRNLAVVLVVCALFCLLNRPSDYAFLLDEIYALREENRTLKQRLGPINIAGLQHGAHVLVASPLYCFGFALRSTSDPDAVLNAAADCLALRGQTGRFRIVLGRPARVVSFGIYHPQSGNARAAPKTLRVTIGDKAREFTFKGSGYQEFALESIGEFADFEILSNYGEQKYTSIYRIYIFS